ncbi:hypothetical protein HYS93_01985 [Candidatus Daviesbacteria bacterium]|nr:hypothetical protein [Candidatus Daviesbacteria bacterium]
MPIYQTMRYADYHSHYTGALPANFLLKRLSKCFIDFKKFPIALSLTKGLELNKNGEEKFLQKYRLEIFKRNIKNAFSQNWILNNKIFSQIYEFFQSLTKNENATESFSLYKEGAFALAESYFNEGVNFFEIKAGPSLTVDETTERIRSMSLGLDLFETKYKHRIFASFVLTFIRREGTLTNFSWRVLDYLLEKWDTKVLKRVQGFDFSGEEASNLTSDTFKIIKYLKDFNKLRTKRLKRPLLITIHCGEQFHRLTTNQMLSNLELLAKNNINRIGHGTVLWIPPHLIEIDAAQKRFRKEILKIIAKRKIHIEICPTSNFYLTPLSSYKDIPFKDLNDLDVRFSLNTDNKTIFSTNLKNEYSQNSR